MVLFLYPFLAISGDHDPDSAHYKEQQERMKRRSAERRQEVIRKRQAEQRQEAMRKLVEGKKQYIKNQRDKYRRDLARYEKNRKKYLENPTWAEWRKQDAEHKRLMAEHKKLYPKARIYSGSLASQLKQNPKIVQIKSKSPQVGFSYNPYNAKPNMATNMEIGGGGPNIITTKAGVKAQRFNGVLFEADNSGLGGSSGCKIDKETGKKVCDSCSYKYYRRIDEKTGKVMIHYHKPKRHTASGAVQ